MQNMPAAEQNSSSNDERRKKVRRMAFALLFLAISFYVAFIVMTAIGR